VAEGVEFELSRRFDPDRPLQSLINSSGNLRVRRCLIRYGWCGECRELEQPRPAKLLGMKEGPTGECP
jgi:hypothetical protein